MKSPFPAFGVAAPSDLARVYRLNLARRRFRVSALAGRGLSDAVTLSRLGLHASAADRFEGDHRLADRWSADAVASLFADGRRDRAVSVADRAITRPHRRLALALASFDPARALKATPGAERDLAAVLSVAAGEPAKPPITPEGRLAIGGRDARDWDRLFASRGMNPIRPRRGDQVTLESAAAEAPCVEGEDKISVIIPVWNTAACIGASVRSILDQGWRNLEVILVDDASNDASVDVALAAAGGDPRMLVLRQNERRGPYVARNRALLRATGRWVAFHDADEWAHPDRLRVQVSEMRRLGLVGSAGRSVRIEADGRARARGLWPLVRFAPSTMMIERQAVLARAGLMHEVWSGGDNEYWWRMTLLFGPRRVAPLPHLLILGAWRAGSQTISADGGYGADGVNAARLAYWEGWNRWHLASHRRPDALRLGHAAQPFTIPTDLAIEPAGDEA